MTAVALPRRYRLKHHQDFNQVHHKGKRFRSPHFVLVILRARSSDTVTANLSPRIGISVSQKVSKRAVQRNRLKRQVRAIMRQFLPKLPDGLRLIIRVQPGAVGCEYQEFLQELERLLMDAGVLDGYSGRGYL